ncbi:MAG: hypothetical protein AB1295_03470 [Candidatus Micrarchaeota archaeon]
MEGKGRCPVSLEIISVGPVFREIDYRELWVYTKRPPFAMHAPLAHKMAG